MIKTQREADTTAKLEAFSFQLAAVHALENKEYAAIFHEQGLGKTKIGLDLALNWLTRDIVDSCLIVTKRSLIANWQDEIRQHTHIVPRIISQDRAANFHAFNSPIRIYLTHYEVLESEEKRFQLFLRTRRIGILMDEAQKIKNPDAALSRVAHALAPGFKRRLIMTGTPIANRPYDLWSQIFFLDQGQSLGKDFADFKAKLDLSNDLDIDLSKRERFEQELSEVYARIQPFTVRETKLTAGINLPDKIFQNWACELEHRQAEIYENYKSELRARVIKEGLPVLDDASEILKRLLRLVQVASNPSMVDESYKREPGKFARLMQILHGAIDQREKAIVWTSFVDNSNWLARELDVLGVVLVNGTVDIDTRNNRLKRFKEEADTRVLVATPGAAKEGLTLTVANHAIFYDRVFSLDDYLQAQDRIHRISQTRPCYVHNLISIDTVDEWVDILIAAKGTAAQLGQGDITLEQYRSSMSYTFGEAVRRVLGFEADDMESETAQ